LPEDANHRRFERTVTAKIADVIMTRSVRVAQDTFQGTTPATGTPARRDEVAGLATSTLPAMDALPPRGTGTDPEEYSAEWFDEQYGTDMVVRGNNVMQYATKHPGGAIFHGEVVNAGRNAPRVSYAVLIYWNAYGDELPIDERFKREDIAAIAEHEIQHVRQNTYIRTMGNDWRILNEHYVSLPPIFWERMSRILFNFFAEADADSITLNQNSSWKFMNESTLFWFKKNYDNAMIELTMTLKGISRFPPELNVSTPPIATNNVQQAARRIVQGIYQRVPFLEMKRYQELGGTPAYTPSFRAPE